MLILQTFSFAEGTPKVYIEGIEKDENSDKVNLNIIMENIESANKMVALRIDVKYDPEKLEFINSKAGKDLKATIKYDEDFPDEGRFSIAILSVGGLSKNGLYYTATFKIKDGVTKDIPIGLEIGEATDDDGHSIKIDTEGTTIKLSSDAEEPEQIEEPIVQIINEFEVADIGPTTTIGSILTENTDISLRENDVVHYEIEDTSVIQILEDGTLVPINDGTCEVTLRIDGQEDENTKVLVEVKDGKIVKITGKETAIEKTNVENRLEPIENSVVKEKNANEEKANDINWFGIIVILFWIFIFIIMFFKIGRKK